MKKYFAFPNVIRIGLACVFFANSLTAFLIPGEFQDLVSGSYVAAFLPISVAAFVTLVGFNDFIVGLLLLSGWRTSRVATYATLWIIGVVFVIGISGVDTTLDVLEHFGFIAMALSLALRGRSD